MGRIMLQGLPFTAVVDYWLVGRKGVIYRNGPIVLKARPLVPALLRLFQPPVLEGGTSWKKEASL